MSVHDDTSTVSQHVQHVRGFTLIEVSVCTVLVGTLLLAALSTLGASARTYHDWSIRQAATLLAQDLMTEILQHPYQDETGATGMGLDVGEHPNDRTTWDDVDDYADFVDDPPTRQDGSRVDNVVGFERNVTVKWVDPLDFKTTAATDRGVKRIRVEVLFEGQSLAVIYAGRVDS